MEVRALIIDDEPLAQQVIQQYAKKLPTLSIVETCNDAISANEIIRNNRIDLLFLDINMPKLSGIQFLRNIKESPLVIFTTAYSEYAIEGYNLDVIDYLKKPFSFERFCKAFFKAEDLLILKQSANNKDHSEEINDFIFIKADKKTIKVRFSDIYYIEGLGDYIKIHLLNEKIVTNLSMKKIISLLPKNKFYRIHKSFIISTDKIELIEGNMVKISSKKLPIGNSYRQDFMQFINSFLAQ